MSSASSTTSSPEDISSASSKPMPGQSEVTEPAVPVGNGRLVTLNIWLALEAMPRHWTADNLNAVMRDYTAFVRARPGLYNAEVKAFYFCSTFCSIDDALRVDHLRTAQWERFRPTSDEKTGTAQIIELLDTLAAQGSSVQLSKLHFAILCCQTLALSRAVSDVQTRGLTLEFL